MAMATGLGAGSDPPMCRFPLIAVLTILPVFPGIAAQADPQDSTPSQGVSQSTVSPHPAVAASSAKPRSAIPPPRDFSGRFRGPEQTSAANKGIKAVAVPAGARGEVQGRAGPTRTASAPAARPPQRPATTGPTADVRLRRVQTNPGDMSLPTGAGVTPAAPPASDLSAAPTGPPLGGQSMSLQMALYGALTSNPDLVSLRQGNPLAASAEAVEVARHFPTTLNPTAWIDYRPITLIPPNTFGTTGSGGGGSSGAGNHGGFYHYGQNYILVSIRQPVELGHQTSHRYHIAQAAYSQQQWTVLQAELTALVQTYRFFQTAAYRRERFRLAQQLADFNDRLLEALRRRLEANQVQAADFTLARVESRATRQLVKAARQDYLTALADLRNQIGIPEGAADAEPLGEFTLPAYIPPIDEQTMVETALANRPDIRALDAQAAGAASAVNLAKGDRIPTPVIGPQYGMDEAGIQYVGLILVSSLPVWNNGKPLVIQREAEHQRALVAAQQARQRTVAQVRAAVARWNGATDLVNDSSGLAEELSKDVATMERLFEAGQSDLNRLMQARQRLIQLDNSRLDAVWAATQSQADLLLALGTPALIHAMLGQAERDATPGASPTSPRTGPAPTIPSPTPGAPAVRRPGM
jgi:outer membrane protein, heavy metal efflux system